MKLTRGLGLTVALLLAFAAVATPQDKERDRPRLKVEADQRYLLLATTKTGTMQRELNEAADMGFRIIAGSPTSGVEMALLLERVAEPPATYAYRVLATTRTGTMQRELNEAAAEGFRLLADTMMSKNQILGGQEVVLVLERPPQIDKRYDYRLLATTKTATLQKEILQALSDGYVLAGMVSRGEHMVIMERESRPKE